MSIMPANDVKIKTRFGEFGADVYEFNEHIKSVKVPYDSSSDEDLAKFMLKRIGFMQEELSEIALAASKGAIEDVADGIVDLLYFTIGSAVLLDLPLRDLWNSVHNANMKKVAGVSKRGVEGDAHKPDDFVAPDIKSILELDK